MPVQTIMENGLASATGTGFKLGQTPPPYTIRVLGGFTGDTVSIQTSHDDVTYTEDFGKIENDDNAPLVMANNTIAVIDHKVQYIRAVVGGSVSGSADVYMETTI